MMYVLSAMYAILVGLVSGWIFYNACAGSKKDRLRVGIIWGMGVAILAILTAFGG
jgi:F0F1-type ATP synthase assembly protein I